MASEQLPEELLKQIMWGLKLDVYSDTSADDKLATRKTLVSCMLANSTLRLLAEPVLYHSISQQELTKLVQCFIRRPRLVGLVKELRNCNTVGHDQLPEGLHDIDAWREENIETCELWTRPYEIPAIGFVLLMCTRLETLVIVGNACDETFPDGDVLAECTALYEKPSAGSDTPLAALRTLVMQPGSNYLSCMNEYDDRWFPGVVSLPNIETIEIAELGMYEFEVSPSISSLKSLTIGSSAMDGLGFTGQIALSLVLEPLLVKCPMLQFLDLTFDNGPNEGDDHWGPLGCMLSNHGSSLRTLHLWNPNEVVNRANDGAPINLTAMANLRTLTLPADAILPSRRRPPFTFEQLADGMNRGQITMQPNDYPPDDEDQPAGAHGSEEGSEPAIVSLMELLPSNLTELAIDDNTKLSSNVARLDRELGKIMLSPLFMDLETVRIWRHKAPTKHLKETGWEVQRDDGCWEMFRCA